MNRHHVQSPVQVLSEISLSYLLLKVLVCCSKHPDIHGKGAGPADTLKFLLLENP